VSHHLKALPPSQDPDPRYYHEPRIRVEVIARNAAGKPISIRHVCSICERLVSGTRHV
jgi:hypothetical protein